MQQTEYTMTEQAVSHFCIEILSGRLSTEDLTATAFTCLCDTPYQPLCTHSPLSPYVTCTLPPSFLHVYTTPSPVTHTLPPFPLHYVIPLPPYCYTHPLTLPPFPLYYVIPTHPALTLSLSIHTTHHQHNAVLNHSLPSVVLT